MISSAHLKNPASEVEVGFVSLAKSKAECSICLDLLFSESAVNTSSIRVIAHGSEVTGKTYHIFHKTCVDPWVKSFNTCPDCRRTVSATLTKEGSMVGKDVILGTRVTIEKNSRVEDGSTIGDAVVVGRGDFIGNGVRIGDNTISKGFNVVEDKVRIGSNVTIGEDDRLRYADIFGHGLASFTSVKIEEGAVIEDNVTLKQGSRVGKGAIVKRGATVERDAIVEEGSIVERGAVVVSKNSCLIS